MKFPRKFFFDGRNTFLKGSLIFLFFFLITRLPYLIYYPVNILSNDSASYISAAFSILNSVTPLFDIRTPGYPVFLAKIWFFSESIFTVSLMQIIFSLFTGILLIYIFSAVYKKYSVVFACCLTVYMTSSYFLILESALLTEGIFTNVLLICAALMILSLKRDRNIYMILFSVSTAVLIFIRPAGMFFFGIIILMIIYFIIKKYGVLKYVSLIIPITVLITGLCIYNYSTLGKFTITPFGEANLAGVTILFMETSDEYPGFVNQAIQQTLDSIPRKDKSYVRNSYGITKLFSVFRDNFHRQLHFAGNLMGEDSTKKYMDIQPYMRTVSMDAIKKNPDIYAKFFMSNFIFFFRNLGIELKYFDQLRYNYKRNIVDKRYITELDKKKWQQISSDRSMNEKVKEFLQKEINLQEELKYISVTDNGEVIAQSTFLKSLYELYESLYNFFLRNVIWYIAFFAMFAFSIYLLLKTRFKNTDAVIAFLICMIFLTKALMVSLVESSLERYSYTVEFAVYFSIPFLLILIDNYKNLKLNSKKV
ncbi:MAG: YlbF family regulator [Ignavibacteria bacterium]|nr:YlbF family regulator [Ignavibacteria bacterium]